MEDKIHLNDYPVEKQLLILKNFIRSFAEQTKTIPKEKSHVTIKSTIKNTGTSDPVITITTAGLFLEEVLEITIFLLNISTKR